MESTSSSEERIWNVWIDWENRRLSFIPLDGYEAMAFRTRNQLMSFVLDHAELNYSIG